MPFDRRGGKWKGKCRRRPTATRMCITSVTGPLTCHVIEVVAEIYQNVDWKSGASGKARLERFDPLKAVGGVAPVLNADLRGQKPMKRFIGICPQTLAEQFCVCQRFYQRFSAFHNTELSKSLSPPAEPKVCQCNQERQTPFANFPAAPRG